MTELRHHFHPRGAVAKLFGDRSPEVLLSGPAGTGKSRGCLEKLHLAALRYPGMQALIVRQTAVSLTSTGLVTWRRFVVTEAERAGIVTYYGGSGEQPAQYRYSNGSSILMGGLDKPTKIMSSEYDMIFVQEATELSITSWEMLGTRARGGVIPYQQIIADCNPDAPTHFLLKRVQEGRTKMYNCKHTDNPMLYNDDGSLTERGAQYMARLDALTGVRRKRLRDGLWVAAEGTVYEEQWSEDYLIDPQPIPDSWQRIWSVDFGYIHPMVIQCWAVDPLGNLILYRELYRTRRTVLDNCKELMSIVAPGGTWDSDGAYVGGEWIEPRPDWIVVDHDAEDRATLERAVGQGTTPADKRIKIGIDRVQERMQHGGIRIMRGSLVSRDPFQDEQMKPCCFVEEVPAYVWKDGMKEEVVKINDDAMDACRYVVMQLDGGLFPGVRFM